MAANVTCYKIIHTLLCCKYFTVSKKFAPGLKMKVASRSKKKNVTEILNMT